MGDATQVGISKKTSMSSKDEPIHKKFTSVPLTPDKIRTMYQDLKRQPLNLEKTEVKIGDVYVVVERCKECDYCIQYCPEDVLEMSDQINSKGYHFPRIVEDKEDSCVLCNMCQNICPEFAIFTKEREEK